MATKSKPRAAVAAAPAAKPVPAKTRSQAATAAAPVPAKKPAAKAAAKSPVKAPVKAPAKATAKATATAPVKAASKAATKKADTAAAKQLLAAPAKKPAKAAPVKAAAPEAVTKKAAAKKAAPKQAAAAAKPAVAKKVAATKPSLAAAPAVPTKTAAAAKKSAASKKAAAAVAAEVPVPAPAVAKKSVSAARTPAVGKPPAKKAGTKPAAAPEAVVPTQPVAKKSRSAAPAAAPADDVAAPVKSVPASRKMAVAAKPVASVVAAVVETPFVETTLGKGKGEGKSKSKSKSDGRDMGKATQERALKPAKPAKPAGNAAAARSTRVQPDAKTEPAEVAAAAAPAATETKTERSGRKASSRPLPPSAATRQPSSAPSPTPSPAPSPAPAPVQAPVQAPPPPPPRFTLQADDERLYGRYRVTAIDGGEHWSLNLRGPRPRDLLCSCQAFALSENGSCEHGQFLFKQLRAELAAGWQAEYSELGLSGGARRQLLWRQSPACPEALAAEAQIVLRGIGHGKLSGVPALAGLLKLAAELGHELRVEAAVWPQLALVGDAAERVRVLGEAYPQLFDSPGLRNLLKLPLPHYQLEAALFAVCAGRSLVADDLGLGLYAQALGAAELMLRHFGVERVLVLCAESSQTRWLGEAQSLSPRSASLIWGDAPTRREQAQASTEIKIAALNTLQQDLALLQGFAPELIIIDEAQRLDAATLERLQQLDRGGFVLMLSSQLLNAQPQILLPLVELLDRHRQGPLADFLAEHVHRDAAGRVAGFMALSEVDETLERLVFSRAKSELLPNLPMALVQLRSLPLSEAQQQLQTPLLAELGRSVARWQRSGFISGAEQLQLLATLQDLRRLAISPQLLAGQAEAGRLSDAPKLIAVAAVARELQGRALDRLRVCSQWDDALALLLPVLQSAGIACVQIAAGQPLAQRQALAERWRKDSRATVLLCSDAAASGLDLHLPRCGLLNLELAWVEDLLEQRLDSVLDEDARGLPLVQLQAQGGIEAALLQLQDGSETLPACGLDGDPALQVLQGEDLTAFMQALAALVALLPGA